MAYNAQEWTFLGKYDVKDVEDAHEEVSRLSSLRKAAKLPVREGEVNGHYWRCTDKVVFVNFKTRASVPNGGAKNA